MKEADIKTVVKTASCMFYLRDKVREKRDTKSQKEGEEFIIMKKVYVFNSQNSHHAPNSVGAASSSDACADHASTPQGIRT